MLSPQQQHTPSKALAHDIHKLSEVNLIQLNCYKSASLRWYVEKIRISFIVAANVSKKLGQFIRHVKCAIRFLRSSYCCEENVGLRVVLNGLIENQNSINFEYANVY